MRILLLTLDLLNQSGGIQKANRLMAHALRDVSIRDGKLKSAIHVYALYDQSVHLPGFMDRKKNEDQILKMRAFNGNRLMYIIEAFLRALRSDVVILSHIHLLPLSLLLPLLKPQLKIVLVAHGIEVWRNMAWWKKKFLRRYAEIWAVSRYTARRLSDQCAMSDVKILNHGLCPDFTVPRIFNKPEVLLKKYNLSAGQLVLLSIGRLTTHERDKGVDLVLQCMPSLLRHYPGLRYLIAGQANDLEKSRLRKLIERYELQEHVTFTGFIAEKELTLHYLLADVFVMPSKKEGFGLVFIEAAACGCKVVAGNKDGSSDALMDGLLGTLIDPDNLQALETAILEHLDNQRDAKGSVKTQQDCLQYFSYNAYLRRITELLNHLLKADLPEKQ